MRNISPRTGRPAKGSTSRDKKLTIALNTEELQMLNDCAKKTQKTRTDIIVEGVELVKEKLDKKK